MWGWWPLIWQTLDGGGGYSGDATTGGLFFSSATSWIGSACARASTFVAAGGRGQARGWDGVRARSRVTQFGICSRRRPSGCGRWAPPKGGHWILRHGTAGGRLTRRPTLSGFWLEGRNGAARSCLRHDSGDGNVAIVMEARGHAGGPLTRPGCVSCPTAAPFVSRLPRPASPTQQLSVRRPWYARVPQKA